MKCLYELNVEQLKNLIENELYLKDWVIWNENLVKRTNTAHNSAKFNKIKKQADANGITYDDTEVVTWFDTLTMLYYTLDKINDTELKDNLKIFQEFCMPYSRKRADYLLTYDNKILIIEFSFDKLGYDVNYEKKLRQASSYKEILSIFLPKEIDIGTYTFLISPEESGCYSRNEVTENNINLDKIEELATVIVKFFKKNLKLAYKSILQIED